MSGGRNWEANLGTEPWKGIYCGLPCRLPALLLLWKLAIDAPPSAVPHAPTPKVCPLPNFPIPFSLFSFPFYSSTQYSVPYAVAPCQAFLTPRSFIFHLPFRPIRASSPPTSLIPPLPEKAPPLSLPPTSPSNLRWLPQMSRHFSLRFPNTAFARCLPSSPGWKTNTPWLYSQ